MSCANLSTGFMFGPCVVTRLCDDPRAGVWLEVAGDKQYVIIRVTNSGRLSVGMRSAKPQRKQRSSLRVESLMVVTMTATG